MKKHDLIFNDTLWEKIKTALQRHWGDAKIIEIKDVSFTFEVEFNDGVKIYCQAGYKQRKNGKIIIPWRDTEVIKPY